MEPTTVGPIGMPAIGLGTLGNDGEEGSSLIEAALAEGYRHLDTSRYYGNEAAVGRGIERSSVPRGEVFLTTKLLHPKTPPMPDLRAAMDESLRLLRTDYVDLLLMHWPNREVSLEWAMEEFAVLREQGKARALGVSNFTVALIDQARQVVDGLVTNQVEYHPYLAQSTLLEHLRANGMSLTAHSPLARGAVVDDPVIREVASAHGASPTQVTLRWLVQQDSVAAIPGARTVAQLRDNLGALDLELADDEMAAISALACGRRIVDPPHGPEWDPA